VVYEDGGGAFLFPYLILVVVLAWPLAFMEMVIGQYFKSSMAKVK